MENKIDTIVFDYGGVIVNIDNELLKKEMAGFGISPLKQLFYARRIRNLMHQFIDGVVPTDETMIEMKKLCRKGTTDEQIIKALDNLCGTIAVSRLETLMQLRKKYKVYMLSNINDILWEKSVEQTRRFGYELEDCFDDFYLSYRMGVAKPDRRIYEQLIKESGLTPSRTLYFDDRKDNCMSGRELGLNAVVVTTNHIEETPEWQQLCKSIQ